MIIINNKAERGKLCVRHEYIHPPVWALLMIADQLHYSDVIMDEILSQINGLTIVYSTVYSGADQRKHQSFASLAFVEGIHRWPVNSPHKGPITRKIFSFGDVVMYINIMYGTECFQLIDFSVDACDTVCKFIIIAKSKIKMISHCLGWGHERPICVICVAIFLYFVT